MSAKGGKRPGAGRKKGSLNKTTVEIRALAQLHAEKALTELVRLTTMADSEQTRIIAIKELLDRAYGKSPQAITGEGGEGPVLIQQLLAAVDGKTRGIPASG